jgi:hypothetical protein
LDISSNLVVEMKRQRTNTGGIETGGTGDVKPNILTMQTGTAGAVATYTLNRIHLPVPRIGASDTKATVTELLWIDWYLNPGNIADTSIDFAYLTTATNRFQGDASTVATMAADLVDPRLIGPVVQNTIVTNYFTNPIRVDLTRNGNGIIVASDNIFIVGGSVGNAVAANFIAKVGYALSNVGVLEYVGVVQSEQTG